MPKQRVSFPRIAWIVVKVVGQHVGRVILKLCRKLKWLFYLFAAAIVVGGLVLLFRWAMSHGADGGHVLSFVGGAFGAGLAVAGARWLAFSAERRQVKKDKAAFFLTFWFAIKTWEVVLRRDVGASPETLYNSGLLRQSSEWAAKVLHLIESDAGKRESADPAKSNAFFSLSLAIKRNLPFFDEINNHPFYIGFTSESVQSKFDKMWFVLFDVIRPAYSALDRYASGAWKSEKISALNSRFEDMVRRLAETQGQELSVESIYTEGKPFSEEESWAHVTAFFNEFKK